MSPIGQRFRNYCRTYPSIINNTMINWFMAWPEDALKEVAIKYVQDNDINKDINDKIPEIFTFIHSTVVVAARRMQLEYRRIYYVTPTNYFELMKGYTRILSQKQK